MNDSEPHQVIMELIDQLGAATLQMQDAASNKDWTLAGRIQEKRVILLRQLESMSASAALGEEELRGLEEIRGRESVIIAAAIERRDALATAIAQSRSSQPAGTAKKKMLDKTYGVGRKH